MHTIPTCHSSQYPYFKIFACLPNRFANAQAYLAGRYPIPIFRYPYKVVLDLVFGMGAVSIFHAESIDKLPAKSYPPKGGGLNQTSDELIKVPFCIVQFYERFFFA